MPTDSKPKVKGKGKGKGLKKKLGPFPTYYWILGGVIIVIGYLYYRHRNQANAAVAPGSQNQAVIPSGVITPSGTGGNGITSSTGDGDGGLTGSTNIFPTDYATQTDLQSAIDAINSDTEKSVASITFPAPSINITVPHSAVAASTSTSKTAAKKAATKSAPPLRYFTKKTQVHLRAGQTLHFAKGKGYYAA
jgi:hypothetical protein